MIWVVDDFYPNPDEIRKRALMLKYVRGRVKKEKGVQLLHPGHRANQKRHFWWENRIYLRNRWKDIVGKQMLDMESMKCNGSFNLGFAEKQNTFSWIHSDEGKWEDGKRMYACVIYLTPNPPPNTGTLLFEHNGSVYDKLQSKDKTFKHPHFYGEYTPHKDWKVHCQVENRYNRLIMYDARMLHAPTNAGFGDTKETARLTQIGFWYGEDKVQI